MGLIPLDRLRLLIDKVNQSLHAITMKNYICQNLDPICLKKWKRRKKRYARDSLAKGYDPETILDNLESSAYHLERHNHYVELFYLKGLDAIGVIES